jgi:hypothetical protein
VTSTTKWKMDIMMKEKSALRTVLNKDIGWLVTRMNISHVTVRVILKMTRFVTHFTLKMITQHTK